MSYDLAVFSPSALEDARLREFVALGRDLAAQQGGGGGVTVVRGARRRLSFTIDGPDLVEDEDVPAEVAEVVLGSRYLYSITVEGAAEVEIPHAVRFARRLAHALGGAVVDQQVDEVWSRSKSRRIRRPQREERVAAVNVGWHCLRAEVDPEVARLFVTLAKRFLPEALPRRFGEYEPYQGKFTEAGEDGFATAWAEATSSLFFSGSGPCVLGSLRAGPGAPYPDKFWSMTLTLLADPFHDPAWRDALRRLFVTLADNVPAFYASAELTRGHLWSGRSLWADGETEHASCPVRYLEGWVGLPPKPTWWSWFGHPFADVVDALPAERVTPTASGVLYEASTQLSGQEGLEHLNRWLPPELFAAVDSSAEQGQPVPLVRASRIPAVLAEIDVMKGAGKRFRVT